ncbi:hypothetical protein [Achromobacter kerstersii]
MAQRILEDSDLIPIVEDFDGAFEKPHERHTREALAVYLLLTCFDALGQERPHVGFRDWMTGSTYREEVQQALELASIEVAKGPVEATNALLAGWSALYGVTSGFRNSIEMLSDPAKDWLFSSMTVARRSPEADKFPNASVPTIPIGDPARERKLKVDYLYSKRNEFTHSLQQWHISSHPRQWIFVRHMSNPVPKDVPVAAWSALVPRSKVVRLGGIHEDRRGSKLFSVSDWPFVLFEVLYSAIDIRFDRTSINLRYCVTDGSDPESGTWRIFPSVPACDLRSHLEQHCGARLAAFP